MKKDSYFEGWGYSDTIKLLIKGRFEDTNKLYTELKKTFPKDDIVKINPDTIEAFIYEQQIPVVKKMATLFKMKIAYKEGGSTEDNSIAKIILDQLGGQRKLVLMTGAYNFMAIKDGVAFKIKNRKVNYIQIVLNYKDLYDVTFSKTFKETLKTVSYNHDVYFDELIPLFEKQTGMYIKFAEGGQTPKKLIYVLYGAKDEADNLLNANGTRNRGWWRSDLSRTESDNLLKTLKDRKLILEAIIYVGDSTNIKFAEGGMPQGMSIADANPYIAGAKVVQGIAPESVSALDKKMASRINPDPYRPVFFKKGGMVVTSISEIPNFKQRLDEGKITYRGLGMGKLMDDFYKLAGESGTRIKVDGKEYFITDTEFYSFSRGSDGRLRIRFDAPFRKN